MQSCVLERELYFLKALYKELFSSLFLYILYIYCYYFINQIFKKISY